MSGVTRAISEKLYKNAVNCLKEVSKTGDISRKLQAIKSSKEHGITLVSKVFGVSRVTIMVWINKFEKSGIEGLKLKTGRGRKSILTDEEKSKIKEWVFKDSNLTIMMVKAKITEIFSKELSLSATHTLLQKLNFSYITPRARHHKQDSQVHPEFKKKSGKKLPGKS
jgi:transposase